MKQRVALAMALTGLVVGAHLTTAAGAGGSSVPDAGAAVANLPADERFEEKPLLCADASTAPEGFDCGPIILADRNEPPIDMRPVDIEILDI
jgi:hypothetical protein